MKSSHFSGFSDWELKTWKEFPSSETLTPNSGVTQFIKTGSDKYLKTEKAPPLPLLSDT